MRCSTRRCCAVCGRGLNSPFETIWVGTGALNAARSSGSVRDNSDLLTNRSDCDNRGKGYIATKTFLMTKGHPVSVEAPHAESICWRKDRNPNNPVTGDWSGWSRIPLAPGQTAETDL